MATLRTIHRQDRDKIAGYFDATAECLSCPTCHDYDGPPASVELSARQLDNLQRGIDIAVEGFCPAAAGDPRPLRCDICGNELLDEGGLPA